MKWDARQDSHHRRCKRSQRRKIKKQKKNEININKFLWYALTKRTILGVEGEKEEILKIVSFEIENSDGDAPQCKSKSI